MIKINNSSSAKPIDLEKLPKIIGGRTQGISAYTKANKWLMSVIKHIHIG